MNPATTPYTPALYLSFELGADQWKIAFTTGLGQRPRMRTVVARELGVLRHEIELAKDRFGLGAEAPIRSCYEAGRDGFWLHRTLIGMGVENVVVDSASIEVKRRKKKVKTDRLDAVKLVDMLVRYHLGETRVWSVVHVPSAEDEDRRQLHRELEAVKKDRRRLLSRIRSLLFTHGVRLGTLKDLAERLEKLRMPTGEPLPQGLRARLQREWGRLSRVTEDIQELVRQRRALLRKPQDHSTECAAKLLKLRAVGEDSSWVLAMEFFGWREFRNGRQVGAVAGLTPTPYQSGDDARELGISKAGNPTVRHIAIELAWSWLRYQPQSELSQWYQRRFGQGKSRLRRIGIVALARKLLIALWRYLETGGPPAGALLKTA